VQIKKSRDWHTWPKLLTAYLRTQLTTTAYNISFQWVWHSHSDIWYSVPWASYCHSCSRKFLPNISLPMQSPEVSNWFPLDKMEPKRFKIQILTYSHLNCEVISPTKVSSVLPMNYPTSLSPDIHKELTCDNVKQ